MSDTANHDLNFNSEIPTNELADGELDERDIEAINGGVRRCPPGDKDDGLLEKIGRGFDKVVDKIIFWD
ncbi:MULTISPECIES: hypothetical protein [unclassified Microcoleus]|uniref:hypothetical protein n=1 Tax=unclassified Microcoleus TaxID=2642155 RepID=UPI002FD000D8